ncbi:MAG: plastocyanin/azurin family copper-binding protein [Calditrichia bacterium]
MPRYLMILLLLCAVAFLSCSNETAEMPEPGPDGVYQYIIRPVGNLMRYDTARLTVKAGTKVRVILENTSESEAMRHNFVLLQKGTDFKSFGRLANKATEKSGYIPQSDAILAHTALSKPGGTVMIQFTAPPPGDYPYLCTFPGHWASMRGILTSIP